MTQDRIASLVVVVAFSVGLGVGTVAIPLLALHAGYDPAAVGFLVATSAAAQLGLRLAMPWLLGRFADRTLIAVSSVCMLVAFSLLLISTAVVVFVTAQLLQGTARAIFWTSSQTHAVRSGGRPVDRLVDLNAAANVGTLVGPALAGTLAAFGLPFALVAAGVGATVAIAGTPLLLRLDAYDRRRSAGTTGLLRRDGVDVACWSSLVSGGWWAMLGSYIPVILIGAGLGPGAVGWLVTLSEGASIVGILALRGLAPRRIRPAVVIGSFGTAAALIAMALAPSDTIVYGLILVLGGVASGTTTTLGPALASLAATADEQGDALSLTGVFRAAALLATPAAVGALLAIASLAAAMSLLGVVLGAPGAVLTRSRRDAPPGVPAAGSASP